MKTRCIKCNGLFYNKGILEQKECPRCRKKTRLNESEEDKARKVREIVKNNPGISTGQVSLLTGIAPSRILNYLKEEVIELPDNSEFGLKCENCGISISHGKLCEKCNVKDKSLISMAALDRNRNGKMYNYSNHRK